MEVLCIAPDNPFHFLFHFTDHVHILYLSNSVSKSRITAKLTIKSQINRRCNRFRDYNTSVAIHQNSNFTVTVYFLSQTFVLWRQHIIFLFLLFVQYTKTNTTIVDITQLLPSFELNIESCQPEDGCFARWLHMFGLSQSSTYYR